MTQSDSSPSSPSLRYIEELNRRIAGREFSKKSSRGVLFTIGGQGGKSFLRLASTYVLARLIAPEGYGIVGMAMLIVGFVEMFKDSGLSYASIQRDKISHAQVSNLFWVNVALSVFFGTLLALGAPLVGMVFGVEQVTDVTRVLAICFVLGGMSVQHTALLRRRMAFGTVVLIEIGSLLLGIGTAITMAKMGHDFWALVGMQIGMAIGNLVLVWSIVRWRPSLPARSVGTKSFLKFGSDILSFNIVNYFARRADDFLIGLVLGPAAMGFYEKSYTLLKLPISQINGALNGVAVPAMSRLKDDEDRWRAYFLGCYEIVTTAAIPIVSFIALFANDIVDVWLGDQWTRSAEIFRWLAPAALLGALFNPCGWLMISKGETRRFRNLGLVNSSMVVTGFAIGVMYSEVGVAIAYSIVCVLMLFPTWYISFRGTSLKSADVLKIIALPLFACALSGAAAWFAVRLDLLSLDSSLLRLAVSGLVFGICYALIVFVVFGKYKRLLLAIQSLKG